MKYSPKLNMVINGHEFSYKIFETLKCVSNTWSQREAAKRLGISHSVLNRRIRESEEKFGLRLVETTGAGSGLTENGYKILNKYEKYMIRLEERDKPVICGGYISAGLIEVLAAEYHLDVTIYQTDDESALELAKKDMVDILTLDDPVWAFMHDLEFIPIAYDYLVLVSQNQGNIQGIDDMNGKNFLEVPGSSQRLAWNTMDNMKINYQIVKLVKSPYNALKTIQNDEKLYTFLNNSFTEGSDILKEETKHLISLVLCNTENRVLKDFVDFVTGNGQKIVENSGFIKI
ncbi:LysR family transcriptional regulator [Methanobacterium spitsbergense]|uniref:LysR family transcriptional regulator n=1 Tax=Methanobacterium spitsbergense TaxID=2874285 RepID=A0A8T5V006_9EURY|nr:LysR family transcriptional regulator [Methanobacterium spitsbergense]MBZ2165171.1 LysR family transcriptional regulator [Methanobacterium spitsbergense]